MAQHRKTNLLTGLLAGVAVGSAVWYLCSTDHGKETCHKIADSLKNFGDNLKEGATREAGNLADKASNLADNLKSKANSYTS